MTKYDLGGTIPKLPMKQRWLLVVITLAVTLDLFRLGAQPLWLDETLSIAIARQNLRDLLTHPHDPWMLLYYLLLKVPLAFSQDEWSARSLSVVFAVAAVPSLYLIAHRLFDDRTALISVLLLAVNSYFINYAQEARSYALTTLLVIWSWYTLLDLVENPGWARTLCYSLVTGALAYCQVFSLLMLPAQIGALVVLRPQRKVIRSVATGIWLVCILSLPMAVMILERDREVYNWRARPNAVALHELTVRFINLPLNTIHLPHAMISLGVITLTIVSLPLYGVVSGLRRMERDKSFGYCCSAFAAVFPATALLTASMLIEPVYSLRYVLPSLPFFLLLLAAGLCELPPPLMRVGFGLLLVANVLGTVEYYRVPTKSDWRGAVEYLVSRIRSDDKVVIYPRWNSAPVDYYLSRSGRSLPKKMVVFPAQDGSSRSPDSTLLSQALSYSYPRLWVVVADPPRQEIEDLNRAIKDLDRRYPGKFQMDFRGISVILYSLNAREKIGRGTVAWPPHEPLICTMTSTGHG